MTGTRTGHDRPTGIDRTDQRRHREVPVTRYDVSGAYRPCRVCEAPVVSPPPAEWTIDLIKEGPATGPVQTFLTPHAEQCDAPVPAPRPGMAVRIPARCMVNVTTAR
jgi:hypothetical protein